MSHISSTLPTWPHQLIIYLAPFENQDCRRDRNLVFRFLRAWDRNAISLSSLHSYTPPSYASYVASPSHSLGLPGRTKQRGCKSGWSAHSPHLSLLSHPVAFSPAGMKEEKHLVTWELFLLWGMAYQQGPRSEKMRCCGRKKPFSSEHTVGNRNMQQWAAQIREPARRALVLER